jgi:hypothetical protein
MTALEKRRARCRRYYLEHREQILERQKKTYQANREVISKRCKEWRERNIQKLAEYSKTYRETHRNEARERTRKWRTEHPDKATLANRRCEQKRRRADPAFRLLKNLRRRLNLAIHLNKTTKSTSTMRLVGCSLEQLCEHLETRFSPGMSWENYGRWHIDHIKPCSSFDLTKSEHQFQCFHYTNLQPLWAEENTAKGGRDAA